ncbi:MAG TPA: bifunctional nicotinamide-nucleotide adenylyltransferase/Nudix hydroxylase, partial [Candidatus Babeliales bacterium]|nr:bifunctional nicotinamide-nucleotide adenylyltransferase/Nudix hydroxylase [Candidatus Babeliales bacterium]
STNQPRTHKNPWVFEERKEMIEEYVTGWKNSVPNRYLRLETTLHILPARDIKYNNQLWAAKIDVAVNATISNLGYQEVWGDWGTRQPKIAIIGHDKDETSFYLKMFPQWKQIEYPMNENISASIIRQMYFEGMSKKFLEAAVPPNVLYFMENFPNQNPTGYLAAKNNYDFCKKYQQGWAVAPYPVKHVTTDAVVVQSGHILLVTRNAEPGEGLLALPGGHLNVNERIVDAMIRELVEETRLKVPEKVLKGSIKQSEVFDAVDRSLIGRVITHAFYIELAPGELPPVKGSDDARKAAWYPISDLGTKLDEDVFFDDHWHIIQKMLGKVQ